MVFNFAALYDARMPTLFIFKKRASFYRIKHATTRSNYSFKLAGKYFAIVCCAWLLRYNARTRAMPGCASSASKVLGAAVEIVCMGKTPSTIRSAEDSSCTLCF